MTAQCTERVQRLRSSPVLSSLTIFYIFFFLVLLSFFLCVFVPELGVANIIHRDQDHKMESLQGIGKTCPIAYTVQCLPQTLSTEQQCLFDFFYTKHLRHRRQQLIKMKKNNGKRRRRRKKEKKKKATLNL